MRRREEGPGAVTPAELVAAVARAGLDGPVVGVDLERLRLLLAGFGCDVVDYLQARAAMKSPPLAARLWRRAERR